MLFSVILVISLTVDIEYNIGIR